MGWSVNFKGFMGYYKLAKKDNAVAKKYFEAAYAKGLSKPNYLAAYATLLQQEKNYELALEVFQKAYRSQMATPQIKWSLKANLATCYFKIGDTERALELAEEMYDSRKNGTAFILYGYFLLSVGRLDEALEVSLKGYEYDDEDASICDNLGQIYYAKGDFEKAETFFSKALAEKDNMVDSLYFMAELNIKKEQYDQAYEYLDSALDAPMPSLTTASKEMILQKLEEIKPFCTVKEEAEADD